MSVPSPRVYVNGDTASPVSGDNLNTFVQTFATAAQMRTLTGVSGMEIALQGLSSVGDGGQGNFYWNASSTAADDNSTVIRPTGVTTGAWIRLPAALVGSDATYSTVTVPGSTTARTLGARFGQTFSVLDYGAKWDNVTDDTAAVNAAILAASVAGGGAVVFPPGPGYMAGRFVIPHSADLHPLQAPITLTGVGGEAGAQWKTAGSYTLGTTIDCRYTPAGDVQAKIDSRGYGQLAIRNLTLADNGTGNGAFIFVTNTTLVMTDVAITGNPNNTGTACAQDAIRFGGTGADSVTVGTGASYVGFQGYGTSLTNVTFERIRRCVQYGGSANSIYAVNCVVAATCGSSEAQGAPFLFWGAGGGNGGNIIHAPIIEVSFYPYAFAFLPVNTTTGLNLMSSVGVYDEVIGSPTVGIAYFGTGCSNNTITSGFVDAVMQALALNGPAAATNSFVSASGEKSYLYQSSITYTGNLYALSATGILNSNPQAALDVGLTTGSNAIRVSGGNTSAGDGSLVAFVNNGATRGGVGNYNAFTGGAYATDIALVSYGVVGLATGNGIKISANGNTVKIGAATSDTIGFYGSAGTAKATVTGSKGANAALASLLTALAGYGILTDSST